jgi:hypothetical protein
MTSCLAANWRNKEFEHQKIVFIRKREEAWPQEGKTSFYKIGCFIRCGDKIEPLDYRATRWVFFRRSSNTFFDKINTQLLRREMAAQNLGVLSKFPKNLNLSKQKNRPIWSPCLIRPDFKVQTEQGRSTRNKCLRRAGWPDEFVKKWPKI